MAKIVLTESDIMNIVYGATKRLLKEHYSRHDDEDFDYDLERNTDGEPVSVYYNRDTQNVTTDDSEMDTEDGLWLAISVSPKNGEFHSIGIGDYDYSGFKYNDSREDYVVTDYDMEVDAAYSTSDGDSEDVTDSISPEEMSLTDEEEKIIADFVKHNIDEF